MERRISISVLHTETRSAGFFHRSFTVYYFKVAIDFTKTFTGFKRFSEIFEFSKSISDRVKKTETFLPAFPEKQINVTQKVVTKRKEMLQDWFRALAFSGKFNKRICKFFQIDFELIREKPENLAQDDFHVLEFIHIMENEQKNRLSIFKIFTQKFLARRRYISKESIQKLFNCLIPLCSSDTLAGCALDFISKLMDREHFYEFEKMRKGFSSFSMESLRDMKLEKLLMSIKNSQHQFQAFGLLLILENYWDHEKFMKSLPEILERNTEAVDYFYQWRNGKTRENQENLFISCISNRKCNQSVDMSRDFSDETSIKSMETLVDSNEACLNLIERAQTRPYLAEACKKKLLRRSIQL